ncbi:hypothetical protein ACWEQL_32340 [Kitasatospora sp. NPDC004240]
MDIVVSGLLAVGRGIFWILSWINTVDAVRVFAADVKKVLSPPRKED